MAETNTKIGLISKILFLIGIVVLIFIFAFALIKFVPKIFSGFASVGQFISSPFSSNNIKIQSSDTDLNSGDKFILSWKDVNKNNGIYNLSYECVENLILQINSDSGLKNILCNTKYNLKEITNAELIPTLKKENVFVEIPIKIEYVDIDNKNILATGEIKINVTNQSKNASDSNIISAEPIDLNNIENDKNNPVNYQSTNYNKADLAITNAYAINDETVTFTISNIGGAATGIWYFEYAGPSGKTQNSPMQISLGRGQGIKYTLNVDTDRSGNVTISADPRNNISENNKINNTAVIRINGNDNSDEYDSNDDADLKVMEFEVGRMSGSNFREDDEIDEDDEAGIRFIVKNIGGESTGSWRYELSGLPYNDNDDDDYKSKSQSSLRPGESREIILEFDNIDEGNYNIKLEVDSDDDIDEEKENNNTESERLEVKN